MAYDDDEDDARPTPPRPAGEGVRIIGAQEAAQREAELQSGRLPQDQPRFGDVPPQPPGPRPAVRFPLPEDESRAATSPAAGDLPHWSEPPTGEVPRILSANEGDGTDDTEDDLEAWAALRRQPRWREGSDWEEADFTEDDELLADDGVRVGAMDDTHRPDYSFDDEEEDDDTAEPPPARTRTATRPAPGTTRVSTRPLTDPYDYGDRRGGDRDIVVALIAGVGLGALALLCFASGPGWTAALATLVVLLAGVEAFDVFRRAGYKPATLLGLVATGALMLGAYAKGERAIPLILALSVMFSMLWYLLGVVRARATVNLGVTMLGITWVGVLGSFAPLMLRYPNREGIAFLFGTIVAVVANDVGALVVGRQFGNTPLAPDISPNKTVEGFFGGLLFTLFACGIFVRPMSPWDFGSAVALGLVVSIVGPIGDLCESMIKRDIGVKDMGTMLPGHGGVLDRFDAMLFALPAAYYLVELLHLPT